VRMSAFFGPTAPPKPLPWTIAPPQGVMSEKKTSGFCGSSWGWHQFSMHCNSLVASGATLADELDPIAPELGACLGPAVLN
jgi:hypothetical protein